MLSRNTARTCLAAALLLAPGLARAEETHTYAECAREPSDADLTAAKAAFQAGNVSFNEADYPRAILYWEDAFRRDCTAHPLLLNLARAYELNGQRAQAVIALEAFLQREPSSPERAQITRRIEVLKKQLEAAPPPSDTAPAPEATQAQPTATETAATTPAPASAPSGARRALPLVFAGVGGAVAIVGVLVYADAHKDVVHYRELCGGENDCPDDAVAPANAAVKRENAGTALTIAGGALLVGGLVWYALTPKKPATTTFVPAVGPGFAGLAVDGRF